MTGQAGQITPLTFHDVKDIEQFCQLIDALKSMQPFLDPSDFSDFRNGSLQLKEDHWMLTFDDGFQSSKRAAQEVFRRFGVKSAFFLCSDFIGTSPEAARKFISERLYASVAEKPMTWDEVRELHLQGHIIGSHTRTHQRLSETKDVALLRNEIISSGDLIAAQIQAPVKWFAYPFGNIESIHSEALRIISERYEFSFSGVRGSNSKATSPYGLRRESMNPLDTHSINRLIAAGGLAPFYTLTRLELDRKVAHAHLDTAS